MNTCPYRLVHWIVAAAGVYALVLLTSFVAMQDTDRQRALLPDENEILRIVLDGADSIKAAGLLSTSIENHGRFELSGKYERCRCHNLISKADFRSMRKQLEQPHLTWDLNGTGVAQPTGPSGYGVSRPLFSRDGRVALLSIERYQGRMAQRGWEVALIQENGAWTKRRTGGWVY